MLSADSAAGITRDLMLAAPMREEQRFTSASAGKFVLP